MRLTRDAKDFGRFVVTGQRACKGSLETAYGSSHRDGTPRPHKLDWVLAIHPCNHIIGNPQGFTTTSPAISAPKGGQLAAFRRTTLQDVHVG